MLTQFFIQLTSSKRMVFNQSLINRATLLKNNETVNKLGSRFMVASIPSQAVLITRPRTNPLMEPQVIPDYPPQLPRPILPESEPEIPPVPQEVPEEPSELPFFPRRTKRKPRKRIVPKRKPKPKSDPKTDPSKNPTPKEEPSPEKPKRFRRRRGNRILFNLDGLNLNAKQLTTICKLFPVFEPNPKSKFAFNPDPESSRIEPGKSKGLGRRKSSIAQVRLTKGKGKITINGKSAANYLQHNTFLLTKIEAPLYFLKLNDYVSLNISVQGGGLIGQADAIKLGISRALCNYNMDYRYPLRNKGYLTRDARVKERKKYGLKKARKAPQYSKR